MYILIFTRFNVRAVHIELIKYMSAHAVILAFVRFFHLYGVPTHIYSDNACSFIAGCKLIKHVVFISDESEGNFTYFNIKHYFTIPL